MSKPEYNMDGKMPYQQGTMLDVLLLASKLPIRSQLHVWLANLRIQQMVRNNYSALGVWDIYFLRLF